MKHTILLLLMFFAFKVQAQRSYTKAEIDSFTIQRAEGRWVDPIPKSVRDTFPKPLFQGKMSGLCFCYDLRQGFIQIGPGKDSCVEIWAQKDYERLQKIWDEYQKTNAPPRSWFCNCNQ